MKTFQQQNMGGLGFHERIQQELSTYTEKNINEDGTVTTNVIKSSYFLVNDIWNIDVIGDVANFKELYSKYNCTTKNIRFEIKNPSITWNSNMFGFTRCF
jgi:hypothetical protein